MAGRAHRFIMPSKRKKGQDGRDDFDDSSGPSQPVKKKKKVLQYDPVSTVLITLNL